MANSNLTTAKSQKNDEFYTMLTDIEKEMKYYRAQFKDKVVYCNCDDARESNFFKYFFSNFKFLGLKKLICTGYKRANLLDGYQHGVVYIYEGNKSGTSEVNDDEIVVTELNGDGDFRSPECIEFLKEADIVVTNPPFSMFRSYMAQLMEYKKKFLIIGNTNAVTFKEIFPHIKNRELWIGKTNFNVGMMFKIPNDYETYHHMDENNNKIGRVSTSCWFTNLETNKKENPTPICKKYIGHEEEYPKYDNYDAIECAKVANLPIDLPVGSVVGVPITVVDKIASDGLIYFDDGNVEQSYQIEKFRHGNDGKDLSVKTIAGAKLHTSEYSSSVSNNGCEGSDTERETKNENDNARERQRLVDKRDPNLCKSTYQAYKITGLMSGAKGEGLTIGEDGRNKFYVNGTGVYARILLQKIK